MTYRLASLACALFGALVIWGPGEGHAAAWERQWLSTVEPVLDRHCVKCHGGVRQRGGLDVRSLENLLRGGSEGPAVVPGNPAESRIVRYTHPGAETQMPPDGRPLLSGSEQNALRAWIASLPSFKPPMTEGESAASTYVKWLKAQSKPEWNPNPRLGIDEVIDGFVRRGWRERKVHPAKPAPEEAFVRRVYLDLAGRIPTVSEARHYVQDKSPRKRERLVNDLLAAESYAQRMRDVFDAALMSRGNEAVMKGRAGAKWHEFLERSFRENRPWNEMVRAMVVARGSTEEDRGAHWFLYERKDNHQTVAEALAPIAYGIRMDCAQCHNHPLSWEIEQRHYWGMVAALKRSKNVESAAGPGVAESAVGGFISFMNLKKESQPALLAFPDGKEIQEVRPGANEKEEDLPDLYVVPPPAGKQKPEQPSIPKISRRTLLADSISRENPLLARAFVNRMWALLLGRGLVHPLDSMDSKHPASHPGLLDWLSRDFEQSGFDVKRLVRGIVLSLPYRLDSKMPGSRVAPPPESFAAGLEKPLTAEQLFASVRVVAGRHGQPLSAQENAFLETLTGRFPDVWNPEYQFTLQQAMFLSNNPGLHRLLSSGPAEEGLEALFERVLGRAPMEQERRELARRKSGLVLWALVTSPEFLLNH